MGRDNKETTVMTYDKYLSDCEKFHKEASEKFRMDAMIRLATENLRKIFDQEIIDEVSEKFRDAK